MAGLDDLYREIILDHYKSPRNRGELACPPAYRSEGYNPLCGDQLTLTLSLDDTPDGTPLTQMDDESYNALVITDVKITGQGCSISQSSASMMTSAIKGKTLAEVHALADAFKVMMHIHDEVIDDEVFGNASSINHATASAALDYTNPPSDSEVLTNSAAATSATSVAPTAATGTSESTIAIADDEAKLRQLGDLAALEGVTKFPVRIKCATLAWNTLLQALSDAKEGRCGSTS